MLLDARSLPHGEVLRADIAILGAGAAGSVLAAELEGSGLDILLLEAGAETYDAALQDPYRGSVAPGSVHPTPDLYRRRVLGGASSIWGGRCVWMDDIDFEQRPWVPHSGWPWGPSELAPFRARAHEHLDIGTMPDRVLDALGSDAPKLIDGLDEPEIDSGRLERFSKPTNLGRKHRDRFAASTKLRLVLHGTVTSIETDGGKGPVTGLACASSPEKRFRVEAKHYVLAAGGLESVRLLLASDPSSKGGLGNHAGHLGRFYQCHAENTLGVLKLTPPGRRVQVQFERVDGGIYLTRKFHLSEAAQREHRLLNAIWRLHYPLIADPRHGHPILSAMYIVKDAILPEYARKLAAIERAARDRLTRDWRFWAAHVRNVAGSPLTLARFGTYWLRGRTFAERKIPFVVIQNPAGEYPLDFNFEQVPNPDSRITLGADRDAFGVPRLVVDWRLTRQDTDSIVATMALLADSFRRSGTAVLDYDPATIEAEAKASVPVGGHHIGAARMSAAPEGGVTDPNGTVWGHPNLHLAGCATFPTCSHANPTLTIVAMAIRLAERLRAQG